MLTLMWLACAPDPGEGKPKAEVVAVDPAPVAAPAAAPQGGLPVPAVAGTPLKLDRAKSRVDAVGAKITATHPIVFHTFDGVVGVEGDVVKGVAFAVEVASLEADKPKLTTHLKDADFLDAPTYPHATFASTEITAGGEGGTHTVTGDLTIHGKTLRVTFPATIAVGAAEVSAKTEFTIDRQDFGVTYPGRPDDLVKDNVVLKIDLVAPRT
ncbi:MAG: YceI family protein [Myxococcota bacterium]